MSDRDRREHAAAREQWQAQQAKNAAWLLALASDVQCALQAVHVPDTVIGQTLDVIATRVGEFHAAHTEREEQLAEALRTNRRIGAAIGMLMACHGCTEDEAWVVLRATSQRDNRKLRDIADDLVERRMPMPGRL